MCMNPSYNYRCAIPSDIMLPSNTLYLSHHVIASLSSTFTAAVVLIFVIGSSAHRFVRCHAAPSTISMNALLACSRLRCAGTRCPSTTKQTSW
eukprot:5038210-Pyramimonas_sp.AAC.3